MFQPAEWKFRLKGNVKGIREYLHVKPFSIFRTRNRFDNEKEFFNNSFYLIFNRTRVGITVKRL